MVPHESRAIVCLGYSVTWCFSCCCSDDTLSRCVIHRTGRRLMETQL